MIPDKNSSKEEVVLVVTQLENGKSRIDYNKRSAEHLTTSVSGIVESIRGVLEAVNKTLRVEYK
jgi:hypothetical protein